MAPFKSMPAVLASMAFMMAPSVAVADVTTWGGQGSGPGKFNAPRGLALGPQGQVYVSDGQRIQRFDGAGNYVSSWSTAVAGTPLGLATDSQGHVYAAIDNGSIAVYDASGVPVTSWSLPTPDGGVAPRESSVAVDADGHVFADDSVNRLVWVSDQAGQGLTSWPTGITGYTHGGFTVSTHDGDAWLMLWDVDSGAATGIYRYGPDGTAKGHIATTSSSWAGYGGGVTYLSVSEDYALGSATDQRRIQAVDAAGAEIARYGSVGGGPGQFSDLGQSAIAPDGTLYVVDRGNNRVTRIGATPTPALKASATAVYAGSSVSFDATSSLLELGKITKYQWDLDGNGTYELDNGTDPHATTTFGSIGDQKVGVRVTGSRGATTADASATVSVRTAPPAGRPIGVSINDGARYVNTPHVTISAAWPAFASDLVISNDGGFGGATFQPVAPQISWTLDSSGPERLPKTVYVRFSGGASGPETYQDDIILDETPPVIQSASAVTGATARIASKAARRFVLKIKATDKTSGVHQLQLATNRKKPSKLRAYKARLSLKGSVPKYVRARDWAGNFSRWVKLRRSNCLALNAAVGKANSRLSSAKKALARAKGEKQAAARRAVSGARNAVKTAKSAYKAGACTR